MKTHFLIQVFFDIDNLASMIKNYTFISRKIIRFINFNMGLKNKYKSVHTHIHKNIKL